MSAYNRVNGTPAAANPRLIETLARQTFGFDGCIFSSDCDSVYDIINVPPLAVRPGWAWPLNDTEVATRSRTPPARI